MEPSAPEQEFLGLFGQIADAVGEAVASMPDRGPSGRRAGQYGLDLVADRIVLEMLDGVDALVLSEESGLSATARARLSQDVPQDTADRPVIVVDPIDGSTNASRGLPWFATALCLVAPDAESGGLAPRVAFVANHVTGERFTAIAHLGAWRNGDPISVSGCTQIDKAIIGVNGLPHRPGGWSQFRALGAASLDICAVACGALDGWIDMTTEGHGVWDYLAALLIATEAGASSAEALGRDLVHLDPAVRRIPAVAASSDLLEQLRADTGPTPRR
jgi:fructose-1,6-bisphosphatase/inositol monophosphatase family enzyme